MDSCIISFNLNFIMQLKQFYYIATKVSSRKKCYYFGDLPDCWSWEWNVMGEICQYSCTGFLCGHRYVKMRVAHAPGMRWRFTRHLLQRKPLVSDPGRHHGTSVTHVPWCMSGSLTRGAEENVPGIPGACLTRNFTYLARGPWYQRQWHWLCGTNMALIYSVHHGLVDGGQGHVFI